MALIEDLHQEEGLVLEEEEEEEEGQLIGEEDIKLSV